MNRKETTAFIKDLQKVLKKHNMTLMSSSNPEKLAEATKGLEGFNFFITKGEKKKILLGGESIMYESTQVVSVNRRKNNEDGD
jgi:hypothetical protein